MILPLPLTDAASEQPHSVRPPAVPQKYWRKRFALWSRFDDGIVMDGLEGWFSATPEALATRVADTLFQSARLGLGPPSFSRSVAAASANSQTGKITVVDLFCGCGGNAIQLALNPGIGHVFAVDTDAARLAMASANAAIYGVPHGRITWIHGDAVRFLLRALEASRVASCDDDGPPHSASPPPPSSFHARSASSSSAAFVKSAHPYVVSLDTLLFRRSAASGGGRTSSSIDITMTTADADGGTPPWRTISALHCAPPWGGVSYSDFVSFSLSKDMPVTSAAAVELRRALYSCSSQVEGSNNSDVSSAVTTTESSTTLGPPDAGPSTDAAAEIVAAAVAAAAASPPSTAVDCVLSGDDLFRAALAISRLVCMYLPRHVVLDEIERLCADTGTPVMGTLTTAAASSSAFPLATGDGKSLAAVKTIVSAAAADAPLAPQRIHRTVLVEHCFMGGQATRSTAVCVYVASSR